MLASMSIISWWRHLFPPVVRPDGQKDIESAADQGNAEAQFAMGLSFCTATGISRDFAQGADWYRKAAEQDHAVAQFQLATMLANGQGVVRDDQMALIWTCRAAEGGDAGAQFDLGSRCHRASLDRTRVDAMESRTEAYKWFQLAAAQGYTGSVAARERVNLSMNREEVVDGNQRVASFIVKKGFQPLSVSSPTTPA